MRAHYPSSSLTLQGRLLVQRPISFPHNSSHRQRGHRSQLETAPCPHPTSPEDGAEMLRAEPVRGPASTTRLRNLQHDLESWTSLCLREKHWAAARDCQPKRAQTLDERFPGPSANAWTTTTPLHINPSKSSPIPRMHQFLPAVAPVALPLTTCPHPNRPRLHARANSATKHRKSPCEFLATVMGSPSGPKASSMKMTKHKCKVPRKKT